MRLRSGQLAAVLGVAPQPFGHPATTALELYEQIKSGRPDRFEDLKRVSRALEPGVLSLLPAQPSGVVVVSKVALWHSTDLWAVDGPPRFLFVAVQRRLAEAGAQRAMVGCLLADGVLKVGSMAAEPNFQRDMFAAERAFLDCLEHDTPPDVADEIDRDVLARMYPTPDGTTVEMPPLTQQAWVRLTKLRKAIRNMRREADTIEARIRKAMGSASDGRLVSGKRLALRPWGHGRRLVQLW